MAAAPIQQDISTQSLAATSKYAAAHPFCPLTAKEISWTAELIRMQWPQGTNLRFNVITLDEPAKREMIPYLQAEHIGQSPPHIDRRAFVAYYIRNTVELSRALTRWPED